MDLNKMGVKELKLLAKSQKVKNWWTLKRDELIIELEKLRPKPEPKPELTLKPKRGELIHYDGKAQNICAWAEELGINPNTLYGRIYKLGWPLEKAFAKKP